MSDSGFPAESRREAGAEERANQVQCRRQFVTRAPRGGFFLGGVLSFFSFLFFFFPSSSFLRHSRLGDGVKIQRVQLVAGGSPTGSLNMRDLVAETLLTSSVLLHVRW